MYACIASLMFMACVSILVLRLAIMIMTMLTVGGSSQASGSCFGGQFVLTMPGSMISV